MIKYQVLSFLSNKASYFYYRLTRVYHFSNTRIEYQYLINPFPSMEAWEEGFTYVDQNMGRLEEYKGKLGDSPDMLLNCLRLQDSLNMVNDNIYVYAGLKLDEDQRVTENQEFMGRAQGLNARLGTAESFIQPEILAISGDRLLTFLEETPELDEYRHFLDDLQRSKAHILSPEQEEILALHDVNTAKLVKL